MTTFGEMLKKYSLLVTVGLLIQYSSGLNATEDDFIQFDHFKADPVAMKCYADDHASSFNEQIYGVNIGGWMVLEPWITPSLFYQFLGGNEETAAGDMFNFCRVLGPEEGNKQLRRHWDTWVTEAIIKELAEEGLINSLRLPVGDWMYNPYGPYIGCTDGALEYVDKLLDWAENYNLSVMIDIHGLKDSQNGFDNSGEQRGFRWTSKFNTVPAYLVTFSHWPIRTANWMGDFDLDAGEYTSYNEENVKHSLVAIENIVDRYKGHPAILGLEPANEPWEFTPIDKLKSYYWEGYLIVKKGAPGWKYMIHDSFRLDTNIWGGFMEGCPDRALDTHMYQAWFYPSSREGFYADACGTKERIASMENAYGPLVVGEWSLATDNCAMWLNGFNDNLSGFPMLPCKYVECADPYMGFEQPGTPVEPNRPIQGPFGTGMSGPSWGMCPVNRDWMVETSDESSNWILAPPKAPDGMDDTDTVMRNIAEKKLNAFSGSGHGQYFWNFRTELDEPQWSYLLAMRRGWMPTRQSPKTEEIINACVKEDTGQYKCVAKNGMLDKDFRDGCKYVFNVEGNHTDFVAYVDSLSGQTLKELADDLYGRYWAAYRANGATCDFSGTARLMELNYTYVPPPGSTIVEEAIRPLFAIMIGVGFIAFMVLFAASIFQIGGYVKKKNLKSLGAIRRSFQGLKAWGSFNERDSLIT